jgi:hypothetical protein
LYNYEKALCIISRYVICNNALLGAAGTGRKDEKEKGFQKDRLFVGGNFGLSFGNYTFINVSPQLGYRFNRFLAAGAGVNLQYVGIKQNTAMAICIVKLPRVLQVLTVRKGLSHPTIYVTGSARGELCVWQTKKLFYR